MRLNLPTLIVKLGRAVSMAEARRLVGKGGIRINGHKTITHAVNVKEGDVVKIGRHEITLTDSHLNYAK